MSEHPEHPDPPFAAAPVTTGSDHNPSGQVAGATIADGVDKSLDPRSVTVSRLAAAITIGIFSVVSLIVLFSILFAVGTTWTLGAMMLAGWFVLQLLLAWWGYSWPGVRYRHASYCVSDQGLRIRSGVIWRFETTVPRTRVQHTDVSRGPLARSFGLATLILHTAGTENASVALSGLPEAVAFAIRDHLIDNGPDDAV